VNQGLQVPTWAVYAEIDFDQTVDYPRLQFSIVREKGEPLFVEPAKLEMIQKMLPLVRRQLLTPYESGAGQEQLGQNF
jgi:hypothetical protein